MRNSGKSMIAAVVAGLGVGAAKLVYGHRHGIAVQAHHAKHTVNKVKRNISIRSFALKTAYKRLPNLKKSKVYRVYARIVPDNPKSDMFQLHAREYLRVLTYAAHRYEYHNSDARTFLGIESKRRMANLTIALLQQKVLIHDYHQEFNRHGINGRNSVDRSRADHILTLLRPYCKKRLINARLFSKALLNIIAIELYK